MPRIFIAIPISEELQKQAKNLADQYSNLPVRWLAGHNLHVTLIPPWETNDITSVAQKLQTIETEGGFEITFNSAAFGPDPTEPRLIWASGAAPNKLLSLLDTIGKTLGVEIRKNFQMHVTLARFKPKDAKTFPLRALSEPIHWSQPVTSFVIMESKLLPTGADYTTLHEFPL